MCTCTCMCACACAYVRVHLRASARACAEEHGEVDGRRTLTLTRTFTLNPDLNPETNPNPNSGPDPNLRADDQGEVGGAQREEAQREEHPARAVERAERPRPAVRRHMVRSARPRLARVPRTYSAWRAGAGCPAPLVFTARRRLVGPRSPCVRHGGPGGREAAWGAQLSAWGGDVSASSAKCFGWKTSTTTRGTLEISITPGVVDSGGCRVDGRADAIMPGAPRLRVGHGLTWVGRGLGRSWSAACA